MAGLHAARSNTYYLRVGKTKSMEITLVDLPETWTHAWLPHLIELLKQPLQTKIIGGSLGSCGSFTVAGYFISFYFFLNYGLVCGITFRLKRSLVYPFKPT